MEKTLLLLTVWKEGCIIFLSVVNKINNIHQIQAQNLLFFHSIDQLSSLLDDDDDIGSGVGAILLDLDASWSEIKYTVFIQLSILCSCKDVSVSHLGSCFMKTLGNIVSLAPFLYFITAPQSPNPWTVQPSALLNLGIAGELTKRCNLAWVHIHCLGFDGTTDYYQFLSCLSNLSWDC